MRRYRKQPRRQSSSKCNKLELGRGIHSSPDKQPEEHPSQPAGEVRAALWQNGGRVHNIRNQEVSRVH